MGKLGTIKRHADLSGRQFDRLTVVREAGRAKNKNILWLCKCECGKEVEIQQPNLLHGLSKSCGCLRNDILRAKSRLKGKSTTPEYLVWRNMIARCYNPKFSSYPKYGARGIGVCDRWRNSFLDFLADMGNRPEGKTIDRINGSLGYSPENCRWATWEEQCENKSNTRRIEWKGKTYACSALARSLGIDPHAFYYFTLAKKNALTVDDTVALMTRLNRRHFRNDISQI